ncbi:MAG: gliding motility-associated C-terminal domain-containing protein [Saprospiraceae bacterium]
MKSSGMTTDQHRTILSSQCLLPNGDGVNELFLPYLADGAAFISFELHVFNRWGGLMFSTTDPAFGWDGILKNEMMNPGVYV